MEQYKKSSEAPSFLRLLRLFAAKTGFAVRPSVRAAEKEELSSRKKAQNTQKRKRGLIPGSPFIAMAAVDGLRCKEVGPAGSPSFLRILRLFAAKTGPARFRSGAGFFTAECTDLRRGAR